MQMTATTGQTAAGPRRNGGVDRAPAGATAYDLSASEAALEKTANPQPPSVVEQPTGAAPARTLGGIAGTFIEATKTPPEKGPTEQLSIRQSLTGAHVFITGVTGYLGSVVLEQLLRTVPGVEVVYVLSRRKGSTTAKERIGRILHSGLFHYVRQRPDLLAKVVVVEGDLLSDGLGLAPEVQQRLVADTTVVIHSAARIALEDPLQKTLHNNYSTTARLLDMAMGMCSLQAFVYVSSTFVNVNRPDHSTVQEVIYPLMMGDAEVDHARFVANFLALSKEDAELKAQVYCQIWGFANTYCLGKHLAEQLARSYYQKGLPVSIVRPSLVSAIAGRPYPGYVGNLAGPTGYALAMALGFYANPNIAAWHATGLLDSVPGDVAATVIIAGAAVLIAEPPHAARRPGGTSQRGVMHHSASGASVNSPQQNAGIFLGLQEAVSRRDSAVLASQAASAVAVAAAAASAAAAAPPSALGLLPRPPGEPLILHSASGTVNPFTHVEAFNAATTFFRQHPPTYRVMLGSYPEPNPTHVPKPKVVKRLMCLMGMRVKFMANMLACFGLPRQSRRLAVGYRAWSDSNNIKYDTTIFFSAKNSLALESALVPDEAADFPLVWRGDWHRFVRTYLAGLYRLYFKQTVLPDATHDFNLIARASPVSTAVATVLAGRRLTGGQAIVGEMAEHEQEEGEEVDVEKAQ